MSIFSDNRQKALSELFIVLEKGIDLLVNEGLDHDLYDAFEKYAFSTIKMIDESYGKNYTSYISDNCVSIPYDYFNPINTSINSVNPLGFPYNPWENYRRNMYVSLLTGHNNDSIEYKNKLKALLQKLISIAKMVVHE